ncbi:MAG: EamA family transporter, partial [Bacteroidia bacterium]|nr:EamA family transporter [Bacteroidia bacterium]
MPTARPSKLLIVTAYATVYIIWGSTYFFIQKAVDEFPPAMMGAIRFLMAGIIMLLWVY